MVALYSLCGRINEASFRYIDVWFDCRSVMVLYWCEVVVGLLFCVMLSCCKVFFSYCGVIVSLACCRVVVLSCCGVMSCLWLYCCVGDVLCYCDVVLLYWHVVRLLCCCIVVLLSSSNCCHVLVWRCYRVARSPCCRIVSCWFAL